MKKLREKMVGPFSGCGALHYGWVYSDFNKEYHPRMSMTHSVRCVCSAMGVPLNLVRNPFFWESVLSALSPVVGVFFLPRRGR